MMHLVRRLLFWISWPALYVYLSLAERSRVLLIDADKVLLVKGRWSWLYGDARYELPGGGIRRREDPKSAAARELAEELGLELRPQDVRFLLKAPVRQRGLRYTAQFFVAIVPQTVTLKLQSKEIAEATWFTITELDPLMLKPEVETALRTWSNSSGLLQ